MNSNQLVELQLQNTAMAMGNRFVGTPINMETYKFPFEQEAPKLPKFEKSNIATIK